MISSTQTIGARMRHLRVLVRARRVFLYERHFYATALHSCKSSTPKRHERGIPDNPKWWIKYSEVVHTRLNATIWLTYKN